MPTTPYSIKDVATLIADIQHIKTTVEKIDTKVDLINGSLDECVIDVAVLADWRKMHRDTHQELNAKVNKLSIGNFSLSAAIMAALAYLGVKQ